MHLADSRLYCAPSREVVAVLSYCETVRWAGFCCPPRHCFIAVLRSLLPSCSFLGIVRTISQRDMNHTYNIAVLQHHELFGAHVFRYILVVGCDAFAIHCSLFGISEERVGILMMASYLNCAFRCCRCELLYRPRPSSHSSLLSPILRRNADRIVTSRRWTD